MSRPRGLRAWSLAGEAWFWLAVAGVVLRTRPFAAATRLAAWPIRSVAPRDPPAMMTGADVRWAVLAAARRTPHRTACFHRALAAQIMLRRRQIASRLYYGARSDGSQGVSAHVWVKLGTQTIVGGDGAERFAVLAVFPPDGQERSGE